MQLMDAIAILLAQLPLTSLRLAPAPFSLVLPIAVISAPA